mmetsp:Transcript_9438/g.8955  ORF Transcript_9438/g.8955 Transcript_9438/m.8955 type:complete len:304 (-) Transcript_9438:2227-3138(-)
MGSDQSHDQGVCRQGGESDHISHSHGTVLLGQDSGHTLRAVPTSICKGRIRFEELEFYLVDGGGVGGGGVEVDFDVLGVQGDCGDGHLVGGVHSACRDLIGEAGGSSIDIVGTDLELVGGASCDAGDGVGGDEVLDELGVDGAAGVVPVEFVGSDVAVSIGGSDQGAPGDLDACVRGGDDCKVSDLVRDSPDLRPCRVLAGLAAPADRVVGAHLRLHNILEAQRVRRQRQRRHRNHTVQIPYDCRITPIAIRSVLSVRSIPIFSNFDEVLVDGDAGVGGGPGDLHVPSERLNFGGRGTWGVWG